MENLFNLWQHWTWTDKTWLHYKRCVTSFSPVTHNTTHNLYIIPLASCCETCMISIVLYFFPIVLFDRLTPICLQNLVCCYLWHLISMLLRALSIHLSCFLQVVWLVVCKSSNNSAVLLISAASRLWVEWHLCHTQQQQFCVCAFKKNFFGSSSLCLSHFFPNVLLDSLTTVKDGVSECSTCLPTRALHVL